MADPVTWAAVIGGVASMAGAMIAKPDKPKIEPPTPAPDDAQIDSARRRRIALAQQQSGVASATLSRPGSRETLG